MTTRNKNIPALRFKEFKEGWEFKKLSELTTKISDGLHSTPKYDDSGEYYFINGNNLLNGKISFSDTTKRVSKAEYEKHKKDLSDKTILISINGTIGSLGLYSGEKIILGKSAGYLNLKADVAKHFVYNILQSSKITNFFISELTGSTIKNLSLTTIKNCVVFIPSLPEQQKIASFLSAIEEKIRQLTRRKELLEQYKKGVMQQLFSSKLRFKDEKGKAYPKWEEKRLGDVATFYNGKAYTQSELLESGKYPVLRVGNFFSNSNWYYSNLELEDNKYCDNGDLLYAWSASFGPKIWDGNKTIYHYHIWKVVNNKMITKQFLYHVLNNETEVIKTRSSNGFALLHITKGTIENWKCKIPSLNEQKVIAQFVDNLNSKIESVTVQIERTQRYKKGLLQKMFV